jgi:acetyltransferase-like isoleucine patch superfamily enzyme
VKARGLLTLLVGLLPASRVKNRVLSTLGHTVSDSCHIGPVVILGATRLCVGDDAVIGPLTAFRHVTAVVGDRAEIGQLNWISAAPFLVEGSPVPSAGRFVIEHDASLTNRHYVDASGGVTLGAFSTVAGVRSVFMTHGIHPRDGVLDTAPVVVGSYAMVGGSVKFVLGATVPDRSVVAMGSTVVQGLHKPGALYAGTPAAFKRDLEPGYYVERTHGPIAPRWAPWP